MIRTSWDANINIQFTTDIMDLNKFSSSATFVSMKQTEKATVGLSQFPWVLDFKIGDTFCIYLIIISVSPAAYACSTIIFWINDWGYKI